MNTDQQQTDPPTAAETQSAGEWVRERCIRLAEIEGDHTVSAGTAPDTQDEPRTCPYCDQPRQDTFENRFSFKCGTSLRADDQKTIKQGDACQLRAQLAAAQAEAGRLREALDNLCIAVAGAGVRHPKERELLQECYDAARAALAKGGGEND